eukprot:5153739-Amphidinium_carterae.2
MNDVRISARRALGKGANLRRSNPLEPMAYEDSVWEGALDKGRGRGPIRHLKTLANRLGWNPQPGGWQSDGQHSTWHEAVFEQTTKSSYY